ncbi:hypothetical protein AB0K40_12750 [Nonomuraea bangladeshensis]|uniref:Uncharacterized protein n=1 Tax=Nonomuraea bangladeshensis TaxID=404385 RepID=A0ABV3H1F9_9ACTN
MRRHFWSEIDKFVTGRGLEPALLLRGLPIVGGAGGGVSCWCSSQRDQALLVYSGTPAGGFSLGLVLGGLPAVPLIPATPEERPRDRRVDVLGALTFTAAIMLLVLGVERAAHADADWTVATIAAGLALVACSS